MIGGYIHGVNHYENQVNSKCRPSPCHVTLSIVPVPSDRVVFVCFWVSFYLAVAVLIDYNFKDLLVFSVAYRRRQIMSFQYPPRGDSDSLFGVNIN